MFEKKLVAVGTVIGYDDWWDLACVTKTRTSPLEFGEALAHAKIAKAFGVQFRCICGPCAEGIARPALLRMRRAYFVVEAIGTAEPSTGYTLGRESEEHYLKASPQCAAIRNAQNAHGR